MASSGSSETSLCLHGLTKAQILNAEATGPSVPATMGKTEERNHHRLDAQVLADARLDLGQHFPLKNLRGLEVGFVVVYLWLAMAVGLVELRLWVNVAVRISISSITLWWRHLCGSGSMSGGEAARWRSL